MNQNRISAIIIFSGRLGHLKNVLKGIEMGTTLPDELILVEMANSKSSLPEFDINIKHCVLSDFEADKLPLGRARNYGAQQATFEILAFLDVDCIPSEDYFCKIKNDSLSDKALYMARPLYLINMVNMKGFDVLKDALEHPIRPIYTKTFQIDDYGQFWSLCFYMNANLFFEIGGFDEDYNGYGAEDTDFAFKCRDLKIPFFLTDTNVYHQQHAFMRPPLNSMEAIVDNSNLFYSKWNVWPMSYHLQKFNDLGFIQWEPQQTTPIKIQKKPSDLQLENAIIHDEPYA